MNLIAALVSKLVTGYIERSVSRGLWTTLAGILGAFATFVGQCASFVPDADRSYLTLGGVILAAVAASLGFDGKNPPVDSVPVNGAATSTQKTGVLAMIMLMLILPFAGCSASSVAQDIVNWTPALQSAVATVDSTAAVLLPADAAIFTVATIGFDAGSNLLVAQAKAYLAAPNATVLAQLQAQIVALQQTVNASLLAAAKITNAASQQHALTAINGVATIVNSILALVAGIKGNTVASLVVPGMITLAAVRPYIDQRQAIRIVAAHYGESDAQASTQVAFAQNQLAYAGF